MTMKYKVILFDADDTLFDFKKSERHAFKETMVDFGFEYDEKIFGSGFEILTSSEITISSKNSPRGAFLIRLV